MSTPATQGCHTGFEVACLVQEYWDQVFSNIQPFCSIQDIHGFFEWSAKRVGHLKSGKRSFIKAQKHVAALVEFQGYISWKHRSDDHMYRLKTSIDRKRAAESVAARTTTNRSRFALPQEHLSQLVEDIAWRKACADDGISLQQFAATSTQTLKRPGHVLDICRVNVKLTDPAEEQLVAVSGTIQFSEIGSAGVFHKLRSEGDNFGYEIGTLKPSSLDPHAAHGARLVHDYQRMNNKASIDGAKGGFAELVKNAVTGAVWSTSAVHNLFQCPRPLISGRICCSYCACA